MATAARTVAVIGAGFSGLLTAIHLLDADPRL
jgi:cation diffusion facilitator CzcD-associated flavoprotein CzcO